MARAVSGVALRTALRAGLRAPPAPRVVPHVDVEPRAPLPVLEVEVEPPSLLRFEGEVLTGLLYLSPDAEDLHAHLNTYAAPFNKLGEKELCPGTGMLEKINAALR